MRPQKYTNKCGYEKLKAYAFVCVFLCLIFPVLFFSACNELQKPKTEPFYAEKVTPPRVQEFRWSNGKMPKSFDPARVGASPEADFVRALYEGLTDTDSKNLQPIPAVAEKWNSSEDDKIWTFHLRKDVKWSNGETVKAQDFVSSWKRLAEMGDQVPQRTLLKNIVGMDTENVLPVFANEEVDALSKDSVANKVLSEKKQTETGSAIPEQNAPAQKKSLKAEQKENIKDIFGVEALNDFTLKVTLVQPDEDFASLVAHPVFRPVYDAGKDFETEGLKQNIVTNGAFRITAIEKDKIVLERADYYWNVGNVQLERVSFVPSENAEGALAAYRAGEVDAVTNADFKPLALKLLTPYDDFQRTTHSALNFYQFNSDKIQFKDVRVRKALAISIERERLTEDELDGASHPAMNFSPFSEKVKLTQDVNQAQKLMSDAGFAEGKDFPAIQLVINRNDVQKRIARAVSKMWKKNLNVETEIIVKETEDYDQALKNGEFDIARRGVVLPTSDETANMLAMFPPKSESKKESENQKSKTNIPTVNQVLKEKNAESKLDFSALSNTAVVEEKPKVDAPDNSIALNFDESALILTEEQALAALPAIPLYFPTSYSLVKPYVEGFEINALDAPSLKNVRINNDWQPSSQKILSNN